MKTAFTVVKNIIYYTKDIDIYQFSFYQSYTVLHLFIHFWALRLLFIYQQKLTLLLQKVTKGKQPMKFSIKVAELSFAGGQQ